MNNKTLYILTGPPGSGKTTWAKKKLAEERNCIHISRDEIRFQLINNETEYFSKEKEVYQLFITKINSALQNEKINSIIVDATHINKASRNKLFKNLVISRDTLIICMNFKTSLKKCILNNSNRKGLSFVPVRKIVEFFSNYDPITEGEIPGAIIIDIKEKK